MMVSYGKRWSFRFSCDARRSFVAHQSPALAKRAWRPPIGCARRAQAKAASGLVNRLHGAATCGFVRTLENRGHIANVAQRWLELLSVHRLRECIEQPREP